MSGGGGSNTSTTTTQSGPPQAFITGYENALTNAQNVAQTQYVPYTGQTVAQFSPDQAQGIYNVENLNANGGSWAPYLQQAQQSFQAAQTPLLTPGLQAQIGDSSGQAIWPTLSSAETGIAGATGAGTSGIGTAVNNLTSGIGGITQSGMQGINNAASSGATGVTGATNSAVGNLQTAANSGISGVQGETNSAVGNIGNASASGVGSIMGYTGAGTSGITKAANTLTPELLQQWESPYTQQVVGATEKEFANQNAQQQQQVAGNAASQGAFGGDREAVAQGITAGQQQLAEAPVIAGLENQGFTTALGAAENQAALQTQAATSAGQLGVQGSTAAGQLGLSGAATAGQLGLQGATTAGQFGLSSAAEAGQLGLQGATTAGQFGLTGAQSAAGLGLQGESTIGQLGLSGAQSAGQLGLQGATTQGQLGLTGATTASQLGMQGVQQELGANEANAWLNSQAGFGEANLGSEAQQLGLQGAASQLQVGSLEQQMAQENLNIPEEQYIAAQAYPFQTAGWLANIAEGLGGASGGTSSTTSPGPSYLSQAAGLGTAGLGLYGAANNAGLFSGGGGGSGLSQGYSDAGALAAASASSAGLSDAGAATINSGLGAGFYRRGGMVPRRASGGLAGGIPDVSLSVIPGASGMGTVPGAHGGNLMNTSTGSTTTSSGGGGNQGAQAQQAIGDVATIVELASLFNRGGYIKRDAGGGTGDSSASAPWYAPLLQEQLGDQFSQSLSNGSMARGGDTHPVPEPTDDEIEEWMSNRGSGVDENGFTKPDPDLVWLTRQPRVLHNRGGMTPRRAEGGLSMSQESPWWARSEERESTDRHGLLQSPIGGRTDQLAISPASGSYVIPADVVSGLGEGNTLAGANVIQKELETGPHGTRMPPEGPRRGPPRPPPAYRESEGMASGGMVPKFAPGGLTYGTQTPGGGINASTGAGTSNTGIPQVDAYLNSTEAGAKFGSYQPQAAPSTTGQANPSVAAATNGGQNFAPTLPAGWTVTAAQGPNGDRGVGTDASVLNAQGQLVAQIPGTGATGSTPSQTMAATWLAQNGYIPWPTSPTGNAQAAGAPAAAPTGTVDNQSFANILGAAGWATGGMVPRRAEGGSDDDGLPVPVPGGEGLVRYPDGSISTPPPPPSNAQWDKLYQATAPNVSKSAVPSPHMTPPGPRTVEGPPPPPTPPTGGMTPATPTYGAGMQAQPTPSARHTLQNFHVNDPDPWLALAEAGFGMMAGRSPFAAENIGAGASKGLESYIRQKQIAQQQNLQGQEAQARLEEAQAWHDTQGGLRQQHENAYQQRIDELGQQVEGTQKWHDTMAALKANGQYDAEHIAQAKLELAAELGRGRLNQGQQRIDLDLGKAFDTSQFHTATLQQRQQLAEQAQQARKDLFGATQDAAARKQIQMADDRLAAQAGAIYRSDTANGIKTTPEEALAKARRMQPGVPTTGEAPQAPSTPHAQAPQGPITFGGQSYPDGYAAAQAAIAAHKDPDAVRGWMTAHGLDPNRLQVGP